MSPNSIPSAPQPAGSQPEAGDPLHAPPSGMRLFLKLVLLFVVMTIGVSALIAVITRYLEPIGKFFN